MSDVVTAIDAARAVLAVASGAPPVVIITAAAPDGRVHRALVHGDDVRGRLPDAVHDTAVAAARAALAAPPDEAASLRIGEWDVLVEVHRAADHLIIVGAGHIAVPLAHLGRVLDFRVTVLDDREDFATPERFDGDVVVLRADFERDPFAGVRIDGSSYIALVTRGHKWDFDCLQRLTALDAQPRYIGMIGSRRRVRAAFHALLDAGVSREVLASIRAPIGLELNAETPAEIAVSIAAELVAVRRGAEAGSISVRERVLDRFLARDA